jgi:Zn finger protein HypA/HybF involved in hydrogenase expression
MTEQRNIDRINRMATNTKKCICPNCKEKVYPKYNGLYWCPKCFKGNAGYFWVKLDHQR